MSGMVLNGELPLNDAYRSAQEAKQTEQARAKQEEADAACSMIRPTWPSLALLVGPVPLDQGVLSALLGRLLKVE